MALPIITVGEPVLRLSARRLDRDEIRSHAIQDLIAHMRDTMYAAPGVGLAAPQVGHSLQLAVIEDKPEYHAKLDAEQLAIRERTPVPFHVIINPVLELLDSPQLAFFEGCLSLPGYTAAVARSRRVRVSCLDHEAKIRVIEASGWYARILQHEIDHLNGTLYIDRMNCRTFTSLEHYERFWKGKSVSAILDQVATSGR